MLNEDLHVAMRMYATLSTGIFATTARTVVDLLEKSYFYIDAGKLSVHTSPSLLPHQIIHLLTYQKIAIQSLCLLFATVVANVWCFFLRLMTPLHT